MPFTFAHPALILPLTYMHRRYVSVTGLIIGSMIPDFEYFGRLKIKSEFSHTLAGVFWLDLPAGILVYLVFQFIVKDKLVKNLPIAIQKRIGNTRQDWSISLRRYWSVVIISLLLGALTHLFWDGFTHHDGFAVSALPRLSASYKVLGYRFGGFKILQHLSSMAGAICLVLFFLRLPKRAETVSRPSAKYWLAVSACMLSVIVVKIICVEDVMPGDLIVTSIAGFLLGLMLTSLTFDLVARKHHAA